MEIQKNLLIVTAVLLAVYMKYGTAAPSPIDLGRECGDKPAEIFFLLDSSSSIWIVDFKKQLSFLNEVVDTFDIGPNKTRVGVSSFSYKYHENFGLDTFEDRDSIKEAISAIPHYLGGTYTYDALDGVRTHGLNKDKVRPGVVKILIVLTDGVSYNSKKTKEAARKVKDDGIVVFAVGIGSNTNRDELAEIASTPTDNYLFEVGSYDLLQQVKLKLAVKACEEKIEGPEELEDAKPSCGANSMADVMFLVDPIGVGAHHTTEIYDFIGTVVEDFNIGDDNIRVGLESQNCGAENIKLGHYEDSMEFTKAIRSTQVSGMTHMITRLRTHAFREKHGGRHMARHMAVIFVDDALFDKKTVLEEARRARDYDVELFVVAIGDSVVDEELMAMVSRSVERHLIRVPSYEALLASKPEFMEKFCHGL